MLHSFTTDLLISDQISQIWKTQTIYSYSAQNSIFEAPVCVFFLKNASWVSHNFWKLSWMFGDTQHGGSEAVWRHKQCWQNNQGCAQARHLVRHVSLHRKALLLNFVNTFWYFGCSRLFLCCNLHVKLVYNEYCVGTSELYICIHA